MLKPTSVLEVLADLFITRGVREHIRLDQGPDSVAMEVQRWIAAAGAKTADIEQCSAPWQRP